MTARLWKPPAATLLAVTGEAHGRVRPPGWRRGADQPRTRLTPRGRRSAENGVASHASSCCRVVASQRLRELRTSLTLICHSVRVLITLKPRMSLIASMGALEKALSV